MKAAIAFLFLALGLGPLAAQASLDIVEKSDYHRYVGGANAGYVYRESRAYLRPAKTGPGNWEGRVLVLEEVYRDAGISSRQVDRSLALSLSPSGPSEGGFPSYRNLLTGQPPELAQGQSWISQAALAIDPANMGDFLVLPVLVEYKVAGPASYAGATVTLVKAKFALRYSAQAGSQEVRGATGTHDLDLYVEPASGKLVFLRDRFDDSYSLASAPQERHTGFTLVFYKGGDASARAGDIAVLSGGPAPAGATAPAGAAASSGGPPGPSKPAQAGSPGQSFASPPGDPSLSSAGTGPLQAGGESSLDDTAVLPGRPELSRAGVDLLDSPEGLVLRIKDLPFVADKADILPGEAWRLDALATSLALLPGRSFLVEGHSASTGRPAGELELSRLRAKKVVDELVARGIPASRFIYRGLGSTKPIAPNDSEAGRARNRRVEITILE